MSVKSKSSKQTSGCCSRKMLLSINPFTQQMFGFNKTSIGDPTGPVQPSGLEGPINTGTIMISDMGEKPSSSACRDKVKKQIIQKIRGMLSAGFSNWRNSSAGSVNTGPFSPYNYIRFFAVTDWEFETRCCDEKNTGSIKSWDNFPIIYGMYLFASGYPNIPLVPPISVRP